MNRHTSGLLKGFEDIKQLHIGESYFTVSIRGETDGVYGVGNLIAAAPEIEAQRNELLGALISAMNRYERCSSDVDERFVPEEEWDRWEAIIVRAKGEV